MVALRWMVLLTLLAGCGPQYVGVPVGDRSTRPVRIPGHHLVRSGDTLYSIAFLYGVSVDELVEWNSVRRPYTIYRGQQLRLSPPPRKVARIEPARIEPARIESARVEPARIEPARPRPPASRPKIQRSAIPAPSRPKTSTVAAPASQPKTAPTTIPAPPVVAAAAPATPDSSFATTPTWDWPANGRLIRRYDANSTGKKGIDIGGQTGDPVRAASAGKVVYAGSGLSGYGRLIIIKHNNDFLSAYAHNRKLLAREGQWVEKQEVIAHMGSSGSDRTALHFEIRKRGRPVDPLEYLPRR